MAEVINHASSFIARTEYDQYSQDLTVSFTDGATFVYHDVPRGTYTSFITSPSKGSAFHRLIKDRFDYEEV